MKKYKGLAVHGTKKGNYIFDSLLAGKQVKIILDFCR